MDPAIGRFMVIDPMADFFNNQSPYSMANNNPVQNVDYYGLGIFNAIGNIFKRIGRGIGSLFNCGCLGNGEIESVREAFIRSDNILPERKKRKPKARKPAPSNRTRPGPLYGVRSVGSPDAQGISLAGTPDFSTTSLASPISIPNFKPTPAPTRRALPLPGPSDNDLASLNVNVNVPFKINSSRIDRENISGLSIEMIQKIVNTLKEYPQIKIAIDANYGSDSSSHTTSTLVNYDGSPLGKAKIGHILSKRATKIIDLLTKAGVSGNQLIKGNGTISNSGPVVKFKVIN